MLQRKIIAFWMSALFLIMISFSFQPETSSTDLYTYYTTFFFEETGSDNAVTAIYLDYRAYDTLFETLLLLVSVIGIIYFSRHGGEPE
jgi:multisubunit Na+/H+ antiporter MnhB subunit